MSNSLGHFPRVSYSRALCTCARHSSSLYRVNVVLAMHSVQWVLLKEPMLWLLAILLHSVNRISLTAQVYIQHQVYTSICAQSTDYIQCIFLCSALQQLWMSGWQHVQFIPVHSNQ